MQLVVKCLEWVYVLVLQHMQYTFLFITFNLCNVFFFYNADDQLLLSSFENIV